MTFLPYKATQPLLSEMAFYIKDTIQRNNLRHGCGLSKRRRMNINWWAIIVSID
jgi:hypothetical protein